MNSMKGAYFEPSNPGWGVFLSEMPNDEPGFAGILYLATDDAHCEYPNFGPDGILWMPVVQKLPGETRYTGDVQVGQIEIVPAGDSAIRVRIKIDESINRGRAQASPPRPYPHIYSATLSRIL